jgi:hypothetical protein
MTDGERLEEIVETAVARGMPAARDEVITTARTAG